MMDLTGINNYNEYYTNHYISSIFEENAGDTITNWRNLAKENEEIRTPWSLLKECAKVYYSIHSNIQRAKHSEQILPMIKDLTDICIESLGYPKANTPNILDEDGAKIPVYLEVKKSNGAPLLWLMMAHTEEHETSLLQRYCYDVETILFEDGKSSMDVENLVTKAMFNMPESPRWIVIFGVDSIALIDRNKWNEKRYLEFDLQEIFSRREESTLQAMAVLLHYESLCPEEGASLLDKLDENSHKHSAGVSQDLKYALRSSIELLGNEVLFDMKNRLGKDLDENPVDAGQLTIECLRYMYRMLFVLFIESRPELGYAPMKTQAYVKGYSLESLRDIAENIREEIEEVGDGYYLHETLAKLYHLIYNGYPETEEKLKELSSAETVHDVFSIEPLKAHIFDPEYTKMITSSKLRNSVMHKIIDLMSVTRPTGNRRDRRGRISYSTLGINQMGAVYEALLSYRGFIAERILFEVKRAGDKFDELDVGYFVPEEELDNYEEDERVRYEDQENKDKLRSYEKGTFIYRLAGREREKSASYYTPEVLTKTLVKYALKELLEGKTADEILHLTICEPAMGSAAFLNEAINQLAEAYIDLKQKELGESISFEDRFQKLQQVKMYIADRNVYGIDLNPIAVELAEVSLWLNTIYKGGFVPWFGTQLVNGNSLIGARRQCYRVEDLTATQKKFVWYNNAPTRIMPSDKRMPKKQVYHFLMGDPGMANYSDKVIKGLAPEEIKKINSWNKEFTKPYEDHELDSLLRISKIIDDLWEKQVELRKEVEEKTADPISVYGQPSDKTDSKTTIREKDWIYSHIYKSEEMQNAGPYARLKFAMDYWCALWFWPIDKADLLPTRSEFLFDMSLILEGGIVSVNQQAASGQLSLFPTPLEEMASNIFDRYSDLGKVDLVQLCSKEQRLMIAKDIAQKNNFFHWELEYADVFNDNGGFDFIIGNPPWVLLTWNEQALLSDSQPLLVIKKLNASQVNLKRDELLRNQKSKNSYLREYESVTGLQLFLNAHQNYASLSGMKANLYKCFLPQSWMFTNKTGIQSFVHPDGIFDDPNGKILRETLYDKLRLHFQFQNEKKLFAEVANRAIFSLNVYSNKSTKNFDAIFNLFQPSTIDECYVDSGETDVKGIKDEYNEWNIRGHKDRKIIIGSDELKIFSKVFDGSTEWKHARLPIIHSKQLIDVLKCFKEVNRNILDIDEIYCSQLWNETNAQKDGIIIRDVKFPEDNLSLIYSGPHISIANPFFQASQEGCSTHRAYDNIDLCGITSQYLPRCNYKPVIKKADYFKKAGRTQWDKSYLGEYRLIMREMANLAGERTLISCIIPPEVGYIHTIFGIALKDVRNLPVIAGSYASLPFDFYVKILGRGHINYDANISFPVIPEKYWDYISIRLLLLNCVSDSYADLWEVCWKDVFCKDSWSLKAKSFELKSFNLLTKEFNYDNILRDEFSRRTALIEIDVIVAMALGMTLNQLKAVYRIQFPVLQSYDIDTWYDKKGKIVFTNNRSQSNVGFSRKEFEEIKEAKSGTFTRLITDDTLPDGPIERTIEYVAPFDRCDREKDYETAWKFFEEKFKDQ